jgi:preprotein translocase subunit SecG
MRQLNRIEDQMNTMQTAVLIGHTIIALLIIVLVLLQRGKGADAGAAFGSGASGTVFGASGASNFFSRATAVLATMFFASSLTLAYMSSQAGARGPESLLEGAAIVEETIEQEQGAAEALPDLPELSDPESTEVDAELSAPELLPVGDADEGSE